MIIVLVTALIIIVLGVYLKKEYQIVREIMIEKPKHEIFDYIKFLKNQNDYSYYNRKDPEALKSYTGTDGEVGFKYRWSSKIKSIGNGTQTISRIIEGEEICCDIQFTKPLPLKSVAVISIKEISPAQAQVTWKFSSLYKFPLNIIIFFADLEKLIGTDIASSLVTLKENLEKS